MSRRARSRPDKRATALQLARFMWHGTAMPEEQVDEHEDHEPEDWIDCPPADADHRVQIGPLDVKPRNYESRA